mmetsp:Transcript_87873/g.238094  ORF Transcript_87873/g.238094 Transcript_87873/m.238094 type:complete len:281 (-) Transcript_87873:239-1081(-)
MQHHRRWRGPDDGHELVRGGGPRDVLHCAVLGAVDRNRHFAVRLQPEQIAGAEIRATGLIDVAGGKNQDSSAVEVPHDRAILDLARQMQLGRLRACGQIIDGHPGNGAALGLEGRDVGGALRHIQRRELEVCGAFLGDDPRLLLIEAVLADNEAFAWHHLQAHGLVSGPLDDVQGQGPARVALERGGVQPLSGLLALKAPDVDVVEVLRVPLLVGHDVRVQGGYAGVAHAARAAADVGGDPVDREGGCVALVAIVEPDAFFAYGGQQLAVPAPAVAEGIR